ncbi:UMP kinase [Coxiella endosymbiont of Amblyomma americanum]|uniref:UMP kinase n=1 Tax=Coxiella endosymbiont of Amblyomma americanum TaxID=325775 RepID=UPI00057DE756|nr:UMP kinase [Coxiella endosymbiont of Amblyomma americanum]AJC50300.1 uridylate kinase [Coxiella endosymbiont of Amblyomma americanum]AUJ58651.1 UMP kinase [Coxiella-like endosymbiont of Amblyomma americanum]
MKSGVRPLYWRVLLKVSGEALVGKGVCTIDPTILDRIAGDIIRVYKLGVQVAIVIGGGNIFRGVTLQRAGISRITGDYMGMLATLINALALRDAFERINLPVRILSAIPMTGVADAFHRRKAIHHLQKGRIVIFASGTGNPLVTTDSAASLRGIEIDADVVLKATNVDGIYSDDPEKNSKARLYKHLTYKEALEKELAIMDLAAFFQCRDHNMPLRIFNINKPGTLLRVVMGIEEGTLVDQG